MKPKGVRTDFNYSKSTMFFALISKYKIRFVKFSFNFKILINFLFICLTHAHFPTIRTILNFSSPFKSKMAFFADIYHLPQLRSDNNIVSL